MMEDAQLQFQLQVAAFHRVFVTAVCPSPLRQCSAWAALSSASVDRATNDLPLHVATFVAEFLKICHRCEIGSTSGIFNVISTFVYLQSYNNKTRRVVKLIVRKCLARMPLATLPLGQIKTKINPRSEDLERPQLLNPLLEGVFSVNNNRQPTLQEVSNLTTSIIIKRYT